MNSYNDNDKYSTQWLQNLIDAGQIPNGYVDKRSILDIKPLDLKKYTQCHFFAGIAGWSYALQLAGWPNDQEVWTGSLSHKLRRNSLKPLSNGKKTIIRYIPK